MPLVSLLPAATEIVHALGALDRVVGVTHECDFPAAAREIERVTATAIPALAHAGEVDAAVHELHESGRPLFELHADRIAELRPDVIVTQALCAVCAVSETDVRAIAARLDPPPRVVTLSAASLDGVLDDIRRVAAALGLESRAESVVDALTARIRRVHEALKAARAPRPRVAVIEWTDPPYAAGHWVPEMVRRAGGVDVLAAPGEHSRPRTIDAIREADPEVILFAPCGYDAPRAAAEAAALLERDAWRWATTRAVWALDANSLVSRPGPRLIDGIETFAAIFNPALFPVPGPSSAIELRGGTVGA